MRNFIVTVDSACDLTESICKELDIFHIDMTYTINEETFTDSLNNSDKKKFFQKIRSGASSKTAAINPTQYCDFWSQLFEKYHLPIVHISISGALSGALGYAKIGAQMLKKEYEDANVYVVDSRIASLGEGMLALMAADMRDCRVNAYDCVQKLESCRSHINTYYTTSTLKYFVEGGRLSKIAGAVGTVLNINPILDCSPDGGLKMCSKARGENGASKKICEEIAETVVNPSEQILFISHSDAPEKAQKIAELLSEQFGFKDVFISTIGTAVGTHCGPGLIAVFYFGKERGTRLMPTVPQPHIKLPESLSLS